MWVFFILRASRLYVGDTPESCKKSMKGIIIISDEHYIYMMRRLARELVVA